MQQDAANHQFLRKRLEQVRGMARQDGLIASCIDQLVPLANRLDDPVSNAICMVSAGLGPCRLVGQDPASPPIDLSINHLLDDASKQRFLAGRVNDLSNVSLKIHDHLEASSAITRLGLRVAIAANSWWTKPAKSAISVVGEPVMLYLDRQIGSLHSSIIAPAQQRNQNGKLTLGGLAQSVNELVQPANLRDYVHADLVNYADYVIQCAKDVVDSTKSNHQLAGAVDVASRKLMALIRTLSPDTEALRQKLRSVALQGRRPIQNAVNGTISYTNNVVNNFGELYDKTKHLGNSTITYLGSHSAQLIPSDVYQFFCQALGMTEKDEKYNELEGQLKDLFDSLTKVFVLSKQRQSVPQPSQPPAVAAPIAA